jgi:hypothetical protein
MMFVLSRYFRFAIITITLGFCSVPVFAMQNAIDLRQARMLALDQYRNQIKKEITVQRSSHNPNKLSIITDLEQAVANVELELRLLLDPDIQNATQYVAVPVPFTQYVPVEVPVQVPFPYMVPVLVEQPTNPPPMLKQAPKGPVITEIRSDQSDIETSSQSPSDQDGSRDAPAPAESTSVSSGVQSSTPIEDTEIKPVESKKIERSWADIAATPPQTLRLADPKITPAVKKFTPRSLHTTRFYYTVGKAKSRQERARPKVEEVAFEDFTSGAASSQAEPEPIASDVSEIYIPEEPAVSDEPEEELTQQKPTEKKKAKSKKKGKQQKRKSHVNPSSDKTSSSNASLPQITEEMKIRRLWNEVTTLLEQIKSFSMEDMDAKNQQTLFIATQILEEIFSLQQNVNIKKVITIDELKTLLTILKPFCRFFVIEALIVRISLVYDFSFEKILGFNKHEFIQHFIQESSKWISIQEDAKSPEFFTACLLQGCILLNGIETEISENQALDLFVKIIQNTDTPDLIRFEAIGIVSQLVKSIPRITLPTIEHATLLKLSYLIVPFLVAYCDLEIASSSYVIAEQFFWEFLLKMSEIFEQKGDSAQQDEAESRKITQITDELLKLSRLAKNALESEVSLQPAETKQKKSTKKSNFTQLDIDNLNVLSALCFGAIVHHLKYKEPLEQRTIELFLKKAALYLETIQTVEGTPLNFTLAKVYDALAQIENTTEGSLKYLRIAHRLSPQSKVYKFDLAKKLLIALNLENLKLAISLFMQLADELQTQPNVDRLCAESAFIIGRIYSFGPVKKVKGFQTNKALGDKYISLAARAGHQDAIKMLKEQYSTASSSKKK